MGLKSSKHQWVLSLASKALGQRPAGPEEARRACGWLKNVPSPEMAKERYGLVMEIFETLTGSVSGLSTKAARYLPPDCYFGEPWRFLFEFDDLKSFSEYRMMAIELYPDGLPIGFGKLHYLELCRKHMAEAAVAQQLDHAAHIPEFPFDQGRVAQKAWFDSFRDLLAPLHGLNPTVRASLFELEDLLPGETPVDQAVVEMRVLFRNRFRKLGRTDLVSRLDSLGFAAP